MAQSHRYCNHEATKSARAKCRREREATGQNYSAGAEGCSYCGNTGDHSTWCIYRPQYRRPGQQRRRHTGPYPRHSCCGNYEAQGHTAWCSNNPNPGTGRNSAGNDGWGHNPFDDFFSTPRNDRIVANDNGGYKVRDYGKGREDLNRDDQGRDPKARRIVQLERKAASTTAHEAAACMTAARRLREAAGLLGQVI